MGQMFRKWGWQKDAIFWIGCHLKPFITILQKKLRVTMMQNFFFENGILYSESELGEYEYNYE